MSNWKFSYRKALEFAARKHSEINQKVPGTDLPYIVHVCNVAMEVLAGCMESPDFDMKYAVQVALLHDTLEDTSTTYKELECEFGAEIAEGVLALTKNTRLNPSEQMRDCLDRIRQQRSEVWAEILADRITSLEKVSKHWTIERRKSCLLAESLIFSLLKGGNLFWGNRLNQRIDTFGRQNLRLIGSEDIGTSKQTQKRLS